MGRAYQYEITYRYRLSPHGKLKKINDIREEQRDDKEKTYTATQLW